MVQNASTPPSGAPSLLAPLFNVFGSGVGEGSFGQPQGDADQVLGLLASEADVLRERLAEGRLEIAQLQQRLRDAESELAVAANATSKAAERLGQHASRQGLVLTASVERANTTKVSVEDELQRVERALWERDQEIARLRREARDLEANHFQANMEMTGLQAMEQQNARLKAAAEDMGLNDDFSKDGLLDFGAGALAASRHQREVRLHEEAQNALLNKQEQHALLKQHAAALQAEAQRLESEERRLAEESGRFERALREKQAKMEAQDQQFLREGQILREHNDELRRALQQEQQDAVQVDQRAALRPQCGAEAAGVRQEVAEILAAIPQLAETLRARGRSVFSVEVPGDPVDVALHAHLRSNGAGDALPIVCRLGPGDYLLGGQRATVALTPQGVLTVGGYHDLGDYLHTVAQESFVRPGTRTLDRKSRWAVC